MCLTPLGLYNIWVFHVTGIWLDISAPIYSVSSDIAVIRKSALICGHVSREGYFFPIAGPWELFTSLVENMDLHIGTVFSGFVFFPMGTREIKNSRGWFSTNLSNFTDHLWIICHHHNCNEIKIVCLISCSKIQLCAYNHCFMHCFFTWNHACTQMHLAHISTNTLMLRGISFLLYKYMQTSVLMFPRTELSLEPWELST